jgi:protein SCO1/2
MRSKFAITAALLASATLGFGQYPRPKATQGVNLEQKLNSPVPLDLMFNDENGQAVPLRTYFGEKPVVLELVYFKCPSLCPMSMRETVTSLRRVPMQTGIDYDVVVVSFDPSDTPAVAREKKAEYGKMFGRAGFANSWHFLTGSQDSITKLASAVGFGYRWDEPSKQFVHAGGIMVATPEGRLSRYFYGVDYAPADLRMALVEASKHRISNPVNYVLLFCFHYDAAQGKYTLAVQNILKAGAALTILLLAGLIYLLMRKDKTHRVQEQWKEAEHVG